MYVGCSTELKGRDGNTSISIRRGVKQGDPLSPFIFNAVVDPLLDFLDKREKGIPAGGRKVSVLAFADDIILASDNRADAVRDLVTVKSSFKALGMTLSIGKCCAFQIKPARKTWTIENPDLNIDGEEVQFVGPDDTFRYLGVNFTPWSGISGRHACSDFVNCCLRIKQLALKPQQRLELMTRYLYPRFRYAMAIDMPTVTLLRTADGKIRQAVKEFLHLSDSVTDGIFYTRTVDGGLDIPRLATVIPFAILKSVTKMGESEDQVLRELAIDSVKSKQAENAARHLRLQLPLTMKEIQLAKRKALISERERWANLSSQGQGVRCFHKKPQKMVGV